MNAILLVGIGGFAGSVARYLLGGWVLHQTLQARFPWSTLAVNVGGCLVAGLLAGGVERFDWFTPQVRLLLFTGLLGGFTTFSAFGIDTLFLLRRGETGIALAYVAASVAAGLGAVLVGYRAVALLSR